MNVQNPSTVSTEPALAPAVAQTPAVAQVPTGVTVTGVGASPADVYIAFRAQRRELVRQLESLEEKRSELSAQRQESSLSDADRKGLDQRLGEIDQRIASLDQQVAAADADVARALAVPGASVEPPPPPETGPPEEVIVLSGMFIVLVFFPIAIAYARRIWRRSAKVITAFPSELSERLNRLDQSTDAIAVEVERIGEGQRFMTRIFTENGAPRARIEESLDAARANEPVPVRR